MIIRREILDYGSEAYVNVYSSGKCKLFVHSEGVRTFNSFDDAFNYWFNEYCN